MPFSEYISEQSNTTRFMTPSATPILVPFTSFQQDSVPPCYLDPEGTIEPPQLFAYQGLPQGMTAPLMGSHEEIGLSDVCFDRVGRFGPYGWGYPESEGGLGIGMEGDNEGIERLKKTSYRDVSWHKAQERCTERYAQRKIARTALVLRTWHDFIYSPHHILMLRALISELSLASRGEYTVHFLIHVRDETIPIWASDEAYNETLRASLPTEFQGMGTLWSVPQMRLVYPPPFPDSFENMSGGNIYSVYRSLHFALQHFASKHEYDYYWNWEMDMRLTGHSYELLDRVSRWADGQSRSFLWERSDRFYIPELYNNSYAAFSESVARNTKARPISGPQLSNLLPIPEFSLYNPYTTDLITFSPIFDPNNTAWIFNSDVTGYNTSLPKPPRRASLITVARLSRRLLHLMHEETFRFHHTMFPEMYPASIALHYGLKAVYAPVPIYFDRLWPVEELQKTFNPGPEGSSGGSKLTVFGPGEHVFRGTSCYSNAHFAGALWRRWLGQNPEFGEGGPEEELQGSGRMCLRSMVLHPVKFE